MSDSDGSEFGVSSARQRQRGRPRASVDSDADTAADSDSGSGSDFGGAVAISTKKKKAAAPASKPKKAAASKRPALKEPNSDDDDDDDDLTDDGHGGNNRQPASAPAARKSPAAPKGSGKTKTIEEIYQKKTQLEHILLRPDTYIGSTEPITSPLWVFENDHMVHRNITYVPGLYKIFDEIIVNAADNKIRDKTMDTMRVTIDRENARISVYNNGRGIPIEIHAKEGVYVPELIFGHLLTSSNYDDDERKVTGGRNGYGAKLCNIFSTQFIVETADSKSGKMFKQVFTKNMSSKTAPAIKDNKKGEDYTRITFTPDLAKFGLESITEDIEALLIKRVYDLAGCVRNIKVFLNDTRIKIKDFKDYIDLYLAKPSEETGAKMPIVYERVSDRWEVAFSPSDGQFAQVSFVNSICTTKGGVHVNSVVDQIVSALIDAVKKKDKKGVPLKPHQVRNHLWVFVNCLIENPTFDSQTKENMTLRASAFGSKCAISEDFIKKVLRTGVVENVLSLARFNQDQLLKRTDGRGKRARINGIPKLDDANNAGRRNADQCTLILTEGDSAKSLAVSGLSVVGRDNFGVFPLRGKLLNVREASHTQITNNAEINAIKQILGLQHGKVYENAGELRYGHLMIMTDQDHDGSHIKGLIINFIDHFWPSLLRVPGFLLEFITPIVRVTRGKGSQRREVSFFTIPEYERWKEANDDGRGWTIKYFKGLGTSTTADAKEYFSDMPKHLKPFKSADNEARELIDMAFNKKKADERKEWLRRFQPGTYMDHTIPEIPIPDFVNKELILFSMADNARSIPSSVDGFKPGQRKILYACFKRNLKSEIKVAQLAGYVAEHSAYHHGEQSLNSTIVGMAQSFVGSNNLALLEPVGQFGTRLQGGKDAASPRYIFTNLTPLARAVFHPADDSLLKYLNDDGQNIEPEWYLPVLPMLLVNGSDGIGTGWSSSVPNYNPRDILQCLHTLMDADLAAIAAREDPGAAVAATALPDLHPWYRGFSGTIERESADRYRVTGTIRKTSPVTVEITELPIRMWTQAYKEQLEGWLNGTTGGNSDKQGDKQQQQQQQHQPWIRDYREYHTDSRVHFEVTLASEAAMAEAEREGLEKRFRLTTTISVTNLVCFDLLGRIKKYDTVNDILRDFYLLRRQYYQKRKDHMLSMLTFEYERLENKVRFVTEIIRGTFIVQNRKRVEILTDLRARKYKPITKKQAAAAVTGAVFVGDAGAGTNTGEEATEGGDDETTTGGGGGDHGYDYLLSMPIWSLTWEKVQHLQKDMHEREEEIKMLLSRTILDLWRSDLDEFLVQWDRYEGDLAVAESQRPNNRATATGGGRGRRLGGSARKGAVKRGGGGGGGKAAKRVGRGGDDDDDDLGGGGGGGDDDDDDFDGSGESDGDFMPNKKAASKAAAGSKSIVDVALAAVTAAAAKAGSDPVRKRVSPPRADTAGGKTKRAVACKSSAKVLELSDDDDDDDGSVSDFGASRNNKRGSDHVTDTMAKESVAKRRVLGGKKTEIPSASKVASAIASSPNALVSKTASASHAMSGKFTIDLSRASALGTSGVTGLVSSVAQTPRPVSSGLSVTLDDFDDDDDRMSVAQPVAKPSAAKVAKDTRKVVVPAMFMPNKSASVSVGVKKPAVSSTTTTTSTTATKTTTKSNIKAAANTKKTAVTKLSASTKRRTQKIVDSDEEEDGDDDDDDDVSPVVSVSVSAASSSAGAARGSRRAAARKVATYRIDDDDDDDATVDGEQDDENDDEFDD